MGLNHSPSIVTRNLLLSLDAANIKCYSGSGNNAYDSISTANFQFKSNRIAFDASTKSFRSTRNVTIPAGGYLEYVGSGPLAAATYFSNDHTTEVLARINDLAGANTNATETGSALFVYQGYHSMFYYNNTTLQYNAWNGTVNAVYVSVNAGVNTGLIRQNNWFHAVTTKSGNTLNMYINGQFQNTATGIMNGTGTSNNIRIGTAYITGTYVWPADCNLAVARMYNRALTAAEIQQNFNATRGRYGI